MKHLHRTHFIHVNGAQAQTQRAGLCSLDAFTHELSFFPPLPHFSIFLAPLSLINGTDYSEKVVLLHYVERDMRHRQTVVCVCVLSPMASEGVNSIT